MWGPPSVVMGRCPQSLCREVRPSILLIHRDEAWPPPTPFLCPHPQGAPCPCWRGFLKQRLWFDSLASNAAATKATQGSRVASARGPAHGSDHKNADQHGRGPALARACLGVLDPEGGSPRATPDPLPQLWDPQIHDPVWAERALLGPDQAL